MVRSRPLRHRLTVRTTRPGLVRYETVKPYVVAPYEAVIVPPCLLLSSAESSGRDDQTAATCALEVALMAAMWAVAAHPYPMTATFSLFIKRGGQEDGNPGDL